MRYLTACALVLSLGAPAVADTIYVPGDYPAIQTAINAATSGDTILVSPGTYFEHDINFNGKSLVIESTAGSMATTIDGEALGTGFIASASEEQVTIRGFSFINTYYWVDAGNSDLAIEIDDCRFLSSTYGGAYLNVDEAIVTDCTFAGDVHYNKHPLDLDTDTTGLVSQCLFTGISVADYCVRSRGANTFTACTFENNSVKAGYLSGNGAQQCLIQDCLFQNNTSYNGVPFLIIDNLNGQILNCTIQGNHCDSELVHVSFVDVTITKYELRRQPLRNRSSFCLLGGCKHHVYELRRQHARRLTTTG